LKTKKYYSTLKKRYRILRNGPDRQLNARKDSQTRESDTAAEWEAGLPDGLFLNQNSNLGKYWRAFEWKMSVYFMTIWNILR
jgi:hypothetical protein